MPNLQQAMNDEIRRLAKKEVKKATEPLKAQITSLRKLAQDLKYALKNSTGKSVKKVRSVADIIPADTDESGVKVRISAKGIISLRNKLNLSQAKLAALVGVTPLAVGHWESGKNHPRQTQILKLSALRKLGKRKLAKMLTDEAAPKTAKNTAAKDEKNDAPKAVKTPASKTAKTAAAKTPKNTGKGKTARGATPSPVKNRKEKKSK